MELRSPVILWQLVLLQSFAVLLSSGLSGPDSSVVSESAVSWAAGARAVLRCQSPRMVWTQDRLHDRQRVVHWDLSGGPAGGPAHRLVDMYSAGEQRVYKLRDRGRLQLPPSAFHDGNFSLLIRAVEETDEGLYTCNLHHHYCHLYESLAVQLLVTDNAQAAGAHWTGEKEVLVVERGAPALLTCVNRAHVWTDRHLEEAQQVVHWDRQPPGVPHDRADRLLDLYASDPTLARGRSVINVIVPEGRAHFFQQLGYVLATLLLFILLLITVVLATRQRRRGGYEYSDKKSKSKGKDVNVVEFAVATGDQALYRSENIQLDYKNNILKERAELVHSPPPPKNIDLDKEFRKEHCR